MLIVPFRLFGSMNLSLFEIFCATTCLSVKVTISPSVLSLLRSVKTALANVDSNKRTPWPLIIKLTEGVVFLNRSDLGAISTLRGIFIALLTRLPLLSLLPLLPLLSLLPSSSIKTHFFKSGWVK